MKLSKNAALYLQASMIVSFLAGSSALTPLYATYQAAWGFTAITTTVIFGIYAVAVLAALLVTGSLSDFVGRRPVLIVATALQVVAMFIFAFAGSVGALLLGRVVQGLATGAAAGAIGAGMLDLDRSRGTTANAIGPMLGTATGGILSGLFVQYLPAPTHLVYLALAGVFAAQAIGVVAMPETAALKAGALASLRPVLRLPAQVRGAMGIAIPALIASWALVGFYGSLGPALVRQLLGTGAPVLGGLTLFVLATSGAVTVLVNRDRPPRTMLLGGTAGLAVGVAFTLLAMSTGWVPAFFLGALIAGGGFGAAFQGAVRSVIPLAHADERAGVLSLLYVVAYLSMGLPAVLGGLRFVYGGNGVLVTAREYGLVVILLAMLAAAGTLLRGERRSAAAPAIAAD
jgi:predicted MFS family arabinose efflux permease